MRQGQWRERLAEEIERQGTDMKAVSLQAGLSDSTVRDIIKRGRDPGLDTLGRILAVLRMTVAQLMEEPHSTVRNPVRVSGKAQVTGEAAAGVWLEADSDHWDENKYPEIPTVPGRYPGVEQDAWRIVGNSVNLLKIEDGDYAICVPYWMVRAALTSDDIVIVERRRGDLREITCKQIVVQAESYELWPRSTDPKYSDAPPLIIPKQKDDGDSGETIEVIRLVIGTFRPI